MIACFQVSVSEPTFVHGLGVVVIHHWPVPTDVSIERPRSIAPFGLIEPAPFLSGSYSTPASSWMPSAVYSRIALTALGVSDGDAGYELAERLASRTSAIEPVVTAVAMLVPLRIM